VNKIYVKEIDVRQEEFPEDCFGEYFSLRSAECSRCPEREECSMVLQNKLASLEEERRGSNMARVKRSKEEEIIEEEIVEEAEEEEEEIGEDEEGEGEEDGAGRRRRRRRQPRRGTRRPAP